MRLSLVLAAALTLTFALGCGRPPASVAPPPTVEGHASELAHDIGGTRLFVDGASIYFPSSNGTELYAIPVDGGARRLVTKGIDSIDSLVFDAESIFFRDSDRIVRLPKAGGEPETLATGQSAWALVLAQDQLCWSNTLEDTLHSEIRCMAKKGGAVTTLVKHLPGVEHMVSDGGDLYWSNDGDAGAGAIMRVAIADGTTSIVAKATFPTELTLAPNGVLWMDGFGVYAAPRSGGPTRLVARERGCENFVADPVKQTIWLRCRDAVLRRREHDVRRFAVASPASIAVGEHFVYWSTWNGVLERVER